MFVKPYLGIEENPRGSIAGSGTLCHVSHLIAFPQLPFFVIERKNIFWYKHLKMFLHFSFRVSTNASSEQMLFCFIGSILYKILLTICSTLTNIEINCGVQVFLKFGNSRVDGICKCSSCYLTRMWSMSSRLQTAASPDGRGKTILWRKKNVTKPRKSSANNPNS